MQSNGRLKTIDDIYRPTVFKLSVNVSDCAGVNVTAIYQDDELTDKETFQVEFETRTDQWRLRTADDTYWILVDTGNGIQSNGNSRYPV